MKAGDGLFKDAEKYFVVVEGEERATIRSTYKDAVKKRNKLAKYSKGKKIYIYRARERDW